MARLHYSRRTFVAGVLAISVIVALGVGLTNSGVVGPAQATVLETSAPPPGREMATLAAGCFWSMEAIFKQLKGVDRVVPGYAGGVSPHPTYQQVENGDTGYAETVNITFDPKQISYRDLLQVLLTTRDPTTRNRQGNDEGPQYRSVIFYRGDAQRKTAESALREVAAARVWKNRIVTEVRPFTTFWRAEDYHLDYYRRHPRQPYCAFVIAPEIAKFRAQFKTRLKS